jgi:uncharacterized membrane protein YebE (DUF533 family)
MGFFGDLFKEKVNWSEKELKALFVSMHSMALMDGNIDENEIKLISAAVENLPGSKPFNWQTFSTSALEVKVEVHVGTLKAMHKKKKVLLLALLGKLAIADGKIDDKELLMFDYMKSVLNVEDK